MQIKFGNLKSPNTETIVIPVFHETREFSDMIAKAVFDKLKEDDKYIGDFGEIYSLTSFDNDNLTKTVFVGLGKEEEITVDKIRKSMAKVVENIRGNKDEKIYIEFVKTSKIVFDEIVVAMTEGLLLSDYNFDKYKSEKKNKEIYITIGRVEETDLEKASKIYEETLDVVKSTYLARDLVNEPANFMTPEKLSDLVKDYSKEFGFEVDVFEEDKIKELKMEAFLSVAKGSESKPRLIVMRYFGDKANNKEVLGLVGKGLTYDSGGYSIKPTDSMVTMKSDMGGAASVIGSMCAVAKRGLKINVVSVIAACENLISGKSYKPGDIIGSMAGKTIEVLNTDAEGRLTLADAVYYAINKEKVTKLVDVATLTGAAIIALGVTTTAVLSNDEGFYSKLKESSDFTDEKIWQLPSFDEYKELLKSKIADLKNIGGRNAGTITAGLFIKEFISDIPWLHLDIAGTSWADSKKEYYSAGGTGVGVRLLYYFIKDLIK